MATAQAVSPRPRFWRTVLLFGGLHFLVMTLGALLVEGYSGGCMFIIPAYFMALVVVLPILILRRFGAGIAVFLPYAILGFPPTYYFEWSTSHSLIGVWGVAGWCLIGPFVGLCADLAFRFLPKTLSEKWRAVAVGAVIGAAILATTLVALAVFYRNPSAGPHYRFFTTGIYFSLPWLVVNGGFAGYTAYAIRKGV